MNMQNQVIPRQDIYGSGNEWKFSDQENASRKRFERVILRLFKEHPAWVGESYQEHLKFAFGFGCCMLIAGTACCIHSILPFLFGSTGSRAIHNSPLTKAAGSDSMHVGVVLFEVRQYGLGSSEQPGQAFPPGEPFGGGACPASF
jgi:hypothetical protein